MKEGGWGEEGGTDGERRGGDGEWRQMTKGYRFRKVPNVPDIDNIALI